MNPPFKGYASRTIASAIRIFFLRRRSGDFFHMDELVKFVNEWIHTAPDSPGRIMRALRQRGDIHYDLVSRGRSLYRVKHYVKLDWK